MEILESDGGTRVTGINAAALALADAGIPNERNGFRNSFRNRR